MANTRPCDECENFDPVLRGVTAQGKTRETPWGWCAKKSVYPANEGPGQRFPEGVKRAAADVLAEPVIVKRGQVVSNCPDFQKRAPRPSKMDLLKQLKVC
jgi:hypothetical protein